MNPVRIKINKLGMITSSEEIILNRFMIFSGESGLGKSYLSILCHYIFAVLLDDRRISSYFNSKGFNLDDLRSGLKAGSVILKVSKKDFEKWLSADALIWLGYMVRNGKIDGDIKITLPSNIPDEIEFKITEELVGLGNNVETYVNLEVPGLSYKVKDSNGMDDESPFAFLFRFYLVQQIFKKFTRLKESYVLPPSRGMMMTETVEPLTGMYVEFKRDLQQMIKAKPDKIEVPNKLKSLIKEILDGHVDRKEGQYFYSTNGVEIPLSAAAASIRELASLEFIVNNSDIRTLSMMIDEPEAHLHPLKQRMMADILSCLVEVGTYVQVTTHSDYFLRRINELMLKFKLKQKLEKEENPGEYYKICQNIEENPDLFLNPDWVSSYLLKRIDGNKSIIISQNTENGVPFSSFHEALEKSLKKKNYLEEVLSDGDY